VPDLASLLDRTTPADLPPLDRCDLADLARRGRHRRRAKRATATAAALVVVLALGAAALTVAGDPAPRGDRADVWAGPAGMPLEEPVGAWTRVADPPFDPRNSPFGGALGDGRIVVWGGTTEPGHELRDGGIYDPSTGDWEVIPRMPSAGGQLSQVHGVQLTADRLAVFATDDGQAPVVTGAVVVYDARPDGAGWLVSPQLQLRLQDGAPVATGWDGEVMAVLTMGVAPEVWRWRIGTHSWERGASAPLGVRTSAGTTFDGRRLAVWGGTSATGVLADGAIYDVASDSWDVVPTAPISGGVLPTVVWLNGRLAVSLSTAGAPLPREQFEDVGLVAIYDPATGDWQTVPPPPGFRAGGGASYTPSDGTTHRDRVMGGWWADPTPAARFLVDTRSPDGWFLEFDHWERAPYAGLFRLGTYAVAVTVGPSDPSFDCCSWSELAVQVQVGPERWLAGAEGPAGLRSSQTIVVSGDKLLVVGGTMTDDPMSPTSTGRSIDDAWVFDLAGRQ